MAPFPTEDFTYSPLPTPTSIRLLRLHRTRGSLIPSLCGYPLIQCSLHAVDLALPTHQSYEALSYTWDSPAPERQKRRNDTWTDEYGPLGRWPIVVHDGGNEPRLLYVRKNLFDALRQLQALHDVDRREPRYGKTRLHVAAEDADVDAVRGLLSEGASCGARDGFGETALHYAAENGAYEIVKVLVASGADMNVYDDSGRLPVHCAVQRKRGDEWELVVRFLRDAAFRSQELKEFHGGDFELEAKRDYDKTLLVQAAEIGDAVRVKDLIRRGANLSAQDVFGESALHYAAENGHYEVVKELVRAGADLRLLDDSERTPLACSLERERGQWKEVARFLRDPQFRHDQLDLLAKEEEASGSGMGATGSGSGFVWIDALCINQNDLDERSAQVRLMPQIYSQASCVIVWLGHDREVETQITQTYSSLKDVMRSVNKKAKKLKTLERQWLVSLQEFVKDEELDWDLPEGGILTIADIKLALGCFLRSWFSRAWVIQELSLAKKIRMFLGDEELDWHEVLKFLCLLAHVGFFRSSSFWKMDAGWRMEDGKGGDGSEAWRLAEIRLRTANDEKEWAIVDPILHRKDCKAPHVRKAARLSLPLMLAASWSFECKDPRDKIYAIMSLAAPLHPEDQITIDYTSPVEDLYTQVGHIFLRGSGRDSMYLRNDGLAGILEPLEGLSFVQDPYFSGPKGKLPELPSWVPDFSNPLVTDRIWRRNFRASKAVEPQFGPTDKSVLTALGCEIDTIEAVEEAWVELEPDDIPSDLEVNVQSWLSMLKHLAPCDGESPIQILFRTLCADQLWKNCDKETRDKNVTSFREFLAWELAWFSLYGVGDDDDSSSSSGWSSGDNAEENSSSGSGSDEESSSDEDNEEEEEEEEEDASLTAASSPIKIDVVRSPDLQGPDYDGPDSGISKLLNIRGRRPGQPNLIHRRAKRSISRLRNWFAGDEAASDQGGDIDPALDKNDTTLDNNDTDLDDNDEEDSSAHTPCDLPSELLDLLNRQRDLELVHNKDPLRRFLPTDDELPAQEDLEEIERCKFHGPSCEDLVNDEDSFRIQMVRVYRKRCLFRSKRGRLGLGPQSVKPGDAVWLLAGSRTPYLLRKHVGEGENESAKGEFRFLGEAYVHGVMYGEAAARLKDTDWEMVHLI